MIQHDLSSDHDHVDHAGHGTQNVLSKDSARSCSGPPRLLPTPPSWAATTPPTTGCTGTSSSSRSIIAGSGVYRFPVAIDVAGERECSPSGVRADGRGRSTAASSETCHTTSRPTATSWYEGPLLPEKRQLRLAIWGNSDVYVPVVLQDREYEVEMPLKDVGCIPLVALQEYMSSDRVTSPSLRELAVVADQYSPLVVRIDCQLVVTDSGQPGVVRSPGVVAELA